MAYQIAYRAANREKVLARQRAYRASKAYAIGKAYAANAAAKQHGRPGILRRQDWIDALERYNHRCGMCGTTERLTLDHKIPLTHPESTNTPDNIGVLCLSCNSGKCDKLIQYGPHHDKMDGWA